MKTEGLMTYWTKPEMVSEQGEYALLMILGGEEVVKLDGEETHNVTFFESHTGKVWYKGNAGAAFGMLQKAFYRLGVPEIGLENYALVVRDGDDLVTVAEFGEPLVTPLQREDRKMSRSEKIMRYQFAWQHRRTAELWKSPIHKTQYDKYPPEITGWMRQRCDLAKAYYAAKNRGLDIPSIAEMTTDWVEIRRDERTRVVVVMGPVLREEKRQEESPIAVWPEEYKAIVECHRAGLTIDQVVDRLTLNLPTKGRKHETR